MSADHFELLHKSTAFKAGKSSSRNGTVVGNALGTMTMPIFLQLERSLTFTEIESGIAFIDKLVQVEKIEH